MTDQPLLKSFLLSLSVILSQAATASFPGSPSKDDNLYGITEYAGELYAAGNADRIFRIGPEGSWETVHEGSEPRAWTGIAAGAGKLVAVASSGDVAVSSGGASWQTASSVADARLGRIIYEEGYFWVIGSGGFLSRSADGLQWETLDTGSEADLQGIAFDGSVFVIVGNEGTILSSTEGTGWSAAPLNSPWSSLVIRDVVFGSEGFLAIARDGYLLQSEDGISWPEPTQQLNRNALSAVTFGNGRYVVAGGVGRELLFFVSENAEQWEEVEVPLLTSVRDLIFDGERFIAAGTYGSVLTSSNGKDWEILASGVHPGLWGVTEKSAGSRIAVGEYGRIQELGSDQSWQAHSPRSSSWLWDIASNENVAVAVGDQGTVVRSGDSGEWEVVRKPKAIDFQQIEVLENCLFALDTSGEVWKSQSGTHWASAALPLDGVAEELAVAGGSVFVVYPGENLLVTQDGDQWFEGNWPSPAQLNSLIYAGDRWVAAGDGGFIATSANGIDWESQNSGTTETITAVAPIDGRIFATDEQGTLLSSADQGATWNKESYAADLRAVATDGEHLVAVGDAGLIRRTGDGINWEDLTLDDPAEFHSVAYGSGRFVAVGDAGSIATSLNGTSWTRVDLETTRTFRKVAFFQNRFIAVGDSGAIADSEDGLTWTFRTADPAAHFSDLVASDDRVIAAGSTTAPSLAHRRGLLFESANGIDWNVNRPAPPLIDEIVGANGKLAAVTSNRQWVQISEDNGQTWQIRDLDAGRNRNFHQIAFGNGRLVVTGRAGKTFVSDNGDDWEQHSNPFYTARGLVFDGSQFVARSGHPATDPDRIWKSHDGVDWELSWEDDLNLYTIKATEDRVVAAGSAGSSVTLLQSVDNGPWEILETNLSPAEVRDLTIWNGQWFAVGHGGSMHTSENGSSWEAITSPVERDLKKITLAGDRLVIVGEKNTVLTSTDGFIWQEASLVSSDYVDAFSFEGKTFVYGSRAVMASEDFASWDLRSFNYAAFTGLAHGPDGFTGVDLNGALAKSIEGANWNYDELPDAVSPVHKLRWAGDRLFALGQNRIWSSVDGSGWEASGPIHPQPNAVIFYDDAWHAVGAGDSRFSSDDAMAWELRGGGLTGAFVSVSGDAGLTIALLDNGEVVSTPDGLTWNTVVDAKHGDWLATGYASDRHILVDRQGRILSSADGSVWEQVSGDHNQTLLDIAAAADSTYAISSSGTLLHSNLDEWEAIFSSNDLTAITYGQGKFVAVGHDGIAAFSDEGDEWQLVALPLRDTLWSVAYGNGKFVAAGENGAVLDSQDGKKWETTSNGEDFSLNTVAFHEEKGFSISGENGFRAHSLDGTEWEILVPASDATWEGSATGTGWFVTVGEAGAIQISGDGRQWEELSEAEGELYSVVVSAEGATAVGHNGLVYPFDLPPLVQNQADDLTLPPGSTATFWAEAGGTPPFEYSWTRDDEPLPEESDELALSNVARSDIGAYRLEISNAAGSTRTHPIFLTVLTSFDDWLDTHGEDLEDEDRLPHSDPFHSGIPNKLAYALDHPPGMPRSALPSVAVQSVWDDGEEKKFLTLTFTRAIGADDILYIPEVSGDLFDWHPLPQENTLAVDRTGSRETVVTHDKIPLDEADGPRFLRLSLEAVE